MREDVSEAEDQREDAGRERASVAANGRAAQPVIDRPARNDGGERDDDGLPRRQIGNGRIDEVGAGIEVVDDGQQEEARDPGEIGLPLEPCEVLGKRGGCREIFLHVVEAAAMNLPCLAAHALRKALSRLQREVQRHEIEGRADPRDAGDHVAPADHEAQPVGDERLQGLDAPHEYACRGLLPRQALVSWSALTAAACRRRP